MRADHRTAGGSVATPDEIPRCQPIGWASPRSPLAAGGRGGWRVGHRPLSGIGRASGGHRAVGCSCLWSQTDLDPPSGRGLSWAAPPTHLAHAEILVVPPLWLATVGLGDRRLSRGDKKSEGSDVRPSTAAGGARDRPGHGPGRSVPSLVSSSAGASRDLRITGGSRDLRARRERPGTNQRFRGATVAAGRPAHGRLDHAPRRRNRIEEPSPVREGTIRVARGTPGMPKDAACVRRCPLWVS